MAYPYSPTTWVNGTTPALSQDNLNKIETGILDASRFVGARVFLGTEATLTTGTYNAITWTAETFDSDGFWTSGSTLVIPTGFAGRYLVTAQLNWKAGNTGTFELWVVKNTTLGDGENGLVTGDVGAVSTIRQVSSVMTLGVADTVQVQARHDTSADRIVDNGESRTFLQIAYLGSV